MSSIIISQKQGADAFRRSACPRSHPTNWLGLVAFFSLHAACAAVFFCGITPVALLLCVACYLGRMFGLTAGYHRYFSHRTYKTSRFFQFSLAWLGCTALQKGPLWWAANHRDHHKYSDTDQDPHSPITQSFWWSHIGWVISDQYDATKWRSIRDFSRFAELRWLNAFHWVPGLLLALFCWVVGGFGAALTSWFAAGQSNAVFSFSGAWSGLIVGFVFSTVLLYHSTFAVNSLCHLFGRRRYATPDQSKNNWWVALLTMGEGWHNNHHHYQSSANQGFFWWEIDVTYYIIRLLAMMGIVWDVRKPPPSKLQSGKETRDLEAPELADQTCLDDGVSDEYRAELGEFHGADLGEYAIAEHSRDVLVQEQDHQIALANALGVQSPDVSDPASAERGLWDRLKNKASCEET